MSSPEHDARMAVAGWLNKAFDKNRWEDTTVVGGEFYLTGIAGAMIDDWHQLTTMIQPALAARREAERQIQRDAGQVWWLIYNRQGTKGIRAECFSEGEARALADAMNEDGSGFPLRIEGPDGVITGSSL